MSIKEYNKCNNCIHAKVCNYSISRDELLDTMNKQLVSWCGTDYFLPEFFEFSFECKEFVEQKNDVEENSSLMFLCPHVNGDAIPKCINLINNKFCKNKTCK